MPSAFFFGLGLDLGVEGVLVGCDVVGNAFSELVVFLMGVSFCRSPIFRFFAVLTLFLVDAGVAALARNASARSLRDSWTFRLRVMVAGLLEDVGAFTPFIVAGEVALRRVLLLVAIVGVVMIALG